MAKKEKKQRKSIGKIVSYSYVRRVKKWMYCPACKEGKMQINRASTLWQCEDCGYKLGADEFEDGYVFWFCDECDTYLNNQEGFDRDASRHVCKNCGYENDTTVDNVKGICSNCGKTLPDTDSTLCVDCRHARRKKVLKIGTGVAIAAAAIVAFAAAVVNSESDSDESSDFILTPESGNSYDCEITNRFSYVTDYWLQTASQDELLATSREMQSLLNELDYCSEEHSRISLLHIDVVNAEASRFPLNLPPREHGWYLPNDD